MNEAYRNRNLCFSGVFLITGAVLAFTKTCLLGSVINQEKCIIARTSYHFLSVSGSRRSGEEMCPISGAVQFLIVIVTLLLLCHFAIVSSLEVNFTPKNVSVFMYDTVTINYTIIGNDNEEDLQLYVENPEVARIGDNVLISYPSGSFNVTGNFLGKTEVGCINAAGKLDVTVVRQKRVIDAIFHSSVGTLVALIYINFGCALDWGEVLRNLKRPIGPVIGFLGQFLIMPLLSFGLGKILFPEDAAMQLGMFFTGVSPAGGASNIWTVVLDGNMDLSVTMTTISTIAAFGMMPLWLFTLGKLIFDQANIQVPYDHISMYAVALVVPLAIGFLMTRYCKRVAGFLSRILKCFSGILLLFIIVFAIITNLYLFQLFSWKIVIAGMGLPYLGYLLGYLAAKIMKQPPPDCLAIAIETGIQNTGIAIFLLKFTLPQPEADLTTVAPVAVAVMTPIPLLIMFLFKKVYARVFAPHRELKVGKGVKEMAFDGNFNAQKEDQLIQTVS